MKQYEFNLELNTSIDIFSVLCMPDTHFKQLFFFIYKLKFMYQVNLTRALKFPQYYLCSIFLDI